MDQAIRNKLRNVVTQCRRLLEESIAQQLQGRYDIYATGKKDEVKADEDVPVGHLSDEERQARQDILAHFKHIEALGYKRKETLEQLIREIAFTHLNRLCAYKMMEVRDVYVGGQRFREAVSRGLKSQGFLFYLADHPDDEKCFNAGHQEDAYRHFLNWLGGTLSQEIGVLFSPTDPANRVYPPQRVLEELLDLLNSEELKGIWSEDETIGWVYQYFTPKELRDQARKESQAPRNSYELAFRNQFFTPRYVVEFLTDNTLGRIWYEMRKGNTRLRDECRYMVRRPGEVFFSEKEDEPDSPVRAMKDLLLGGTEETFPPFRAGETQRLVEFAHTVDGYERHPFEDQVEGEWWPWAKLREIRETEDLTQFPAQDLLDVLFCQARADRHAGGYGDWDEIFYAIANEIRRRCLEGQQEDASRKQLLLAITAIPHRPEKDPREIKILDPACGSGHFLLYCFDLLLTIYEEAYGDKEFGPALQRDYPTLDDFRREVPRLILAHNLHGIDIDLRCTQIAALALWLRCQRAYQEMGLKKNRPKITRSNIVSAEPMPGEQSMLKEFVGQLEPKLLGQLVEVIFDKMKLAGEAGSLLKIEEDIRDAVAGARMQWLTGPISIQRTLFDDDKPVVQQRRFDFSGITDSQFFEQAEAKVVEALRSYAGKAHDGQKLQRKLFADDTQRGFAFVDLCRKWYDVILMNPPFGSATTETATWFRNQYSSAAENLTVGVILQSLNRLAQSGMVGLIGDLPWLQQSTYTTFRTKILEARSLKLFVELGWGILGTDVEVGLAVFTTRMVEATDFASLVGVEDQATALLETFTASERFRTRKLSDFQVIENHPFAYQISDLSLRVFRERRLLSEQLFVAAGGVKASDADRVFRCWWEVRTESIGRDRQWNFCQNGSPYCPFYYPTYFVILSDRGSFETVMSYPTARTPNSERYWQPGLAYGKRTWEMYCYPMPAEQVITQEGNALFPISMEDAWQCVALANSSHYSTLTNLVAGQHKYAGYLNTICMDAERLPSLGAIAEEIYRRVRQIDSLNELSHAFIPPL